MEKCKEYLKNNFSNGPKAKKILAIATPLFVISVMSICVVANARKTVTINVDGNEQIFVTYKRTIKDALKQVGIELGSKDKVEPALEKKLVKDEVIEVVTPGKFHLGESEFKAVYEESEISGMDGTTTTLVIKDEALILEREGSTTTRMEFKKGEEVVSLYNTPYGMMNINIYTKELDIDMDDDGGVVYTKYILGLEGQSGITIELKVKIRAN